MNFIEKFISDNPRIYARERAGVQVTERVWKAMNERWLSKADVAEMAGWPIRRINRLLNGDGKVCVKDLAEIMWLIENIQKGK